MQAPNSWNHARLARAFQARELDMPKSSLVTLSIHLRIHFLANGPFISGIAKSLAHRNSLSVLAVDLPDWEFPVSIVTLKNRTLSPVVERFIECAREEGKRQRR